MLNSKDASTTSMEVLFMATALSVCSFHACLNLDVVGRKVDSGSHLPHQPGLRHQSSTHAVRIGAQA